MVNNHKHYSLIQTIHNKKLNLSDPTIIDNACIAIMEIAFEGGFRGGGAYRQWNCGSWLNSDIEEIFSISLNFGKGIKFYELEFGKEKTLEEWMNFYDSYLILPIYSYKGKGLSASELKTNNEIAIKAWIQLHEEWKKKGLSGYKE